MDEPQLTEEQSGGTWSIRKRRKISPDQRKQRDYKRQRRSWSTGAAYRKLKKELPPIRRRRWRRALDGATYSAANDEEAALTLAETLHSVRRVRFNILMDGPHRRTSSFRDALSGKLRRRAQREARDK